MSRPIFPTLCLIACTVLLGHAASAAEMLVLAAPERAPLPVVCQKADRDAAEALARYLGQITGQEIPVRTVDAAPTTPAIRVGAFGAADAAELRGESYVIRADAAGLQLYGRTPRATAFAVYGFLEDELGCRWWSLSEEDVPRRETASVAHQERRFDAPFLLTHLYTREATTNRLDFPLKSRALNDEDWTQSHAMYRLMAPYGKTHPEIYPLTKKSGGKRKPNDLHLCYTAPGLPEALAVAIEGEIKKNRGNVRDIVYMADMGDWYGGTCECDTCMAVYAEEQWTLEDGTVREAPSSTLIRLLNRTAEILEADYPGIRLGTQAYMSLQGPPGKTRPRHNVMIRVPHLRHCIVHDYTCGSNRHYLRDLKRWCEIAPGQVYIWDYSVNFGGNFLVPFPIIESMSRNIQMAAELGVTGIVLQGNYVSTGGDLVVLKNYVWRKMLWNPSLDPRALIHEFCVGYYGPAAADVERYVLRLEDAAKKAKHFDEFEEWPSYLKALFEEGELAELRAILDQAAGATVGQAPYDRRVAEAMVSMQMAGLYWDPPLVEHDGRIARQTRSGPVYSYDEALSMLQNSREASLREWAAFRSYHQGFLIKHGGPLVVLKADQLVVKVSPTQNLRAWQIEFDGNPLLTLPGDPKDKEYPSTGGLREIPTPPWLVGFIDGEPTETKVNLTGVFESGSSEKAYHTKSFEVLPGNILRIHAETKTLLKGSGHKAVGGVAQAEYDVGERAAGVRVEAFVDGTWVELLPAKTTGMLVTAEIPEAATALMVTLPLRETQIQDRLLEPGVTMNGGTVTLDRKARVLTTSIKTRYRGLDYGTFVPWLDRELRFRKIPNDAP